MIVVVPGLIIQPMSEGNDGHTAKILVVEDDGAMARLITSTLALDGYAVDVASSLAEAREALLSSPRDIIVLDFGLPDGDGLDLLRSGVHGSASVVCLTAQPAGELIVRALDSGADDYLVKPFHPDELLARVRAILRRSEPEDSDDRIIVAGDVTVDLTRRLVKKRGEIVQLTGNEWKLLAALARSAGKVVPNPELLRQVWGPGFENDVQYLRVWVSRLRMKLEDDRNHPTVVITLGGVGYSLAADADEPAAT